MSAVTGGEPRVLAPSVRPPLAVPRRLLRMRSDAVLAERVAAGDETAFDVLYERHRPVVLAVCMGVLGTAHDAEDATQETFTALSIALRNNIPSELRPWLIRVARNASIDTTRRRKHRLLTLDGELPDIPARPTTGKAEFAVVMDGIRELPEQQRTALLMRELGGHSYGEIGDFLELEEDAVRGLIARARVGLRTYREATELPCATARACIETEPDGRRYGKTIRRHLRGCASCRSYRTALRGDAKALRAALPLQAGAFSTSTTGLATGALSASKAALVGAGMTQLAATCAASVCAVGTVGGMVLIAPVHNLLGDHFAKPPITVVAKPHHHRVSHVAAVVHKPAVAPTESYVASYVPVAAATEKSSSSSATGAVTHHRSQKHSGLLRSSGTRTHNGTGFDHRRGPASAGSRQSANPAPASTPTQPVSTAGGAAGTPTATAPTATTPTATTPTATTPTPTWGSSGGGNTYGGRTAGSPSGSGGTGTTPVAQPPITPVAQPPITPVVSSTTQTATQATTPSGPSQGGSGPTSNWQHQGAPPTNSGWDQQNPPSSGSGWGQQSAPDSNPGWGQHGASTSSPGWGQQSAQTSTFGSGQGSSWRGSF